MMQNPMGVVEEPANCGECAAACAFKRAGCAFDLWKDADKLLQRVGAAGAAPEILEATRAALKNELSRKGKECREALIPKIRSHNEVASLAERVVKYLGLPNGATPETPRLGNRASEPKIRADAGSSGNIEPGNPGRVDDGGPGLPRRITADDRATSKPRRRQKNGRDDLYISLQDRETEAGILEANEPDVFGICVAPRMRVEKMKGDARQETLREWVPMFQRAPFKGIVAAIPKVHEKDPSLCRVTVYYRGPPAKQAKAVLREWKNSAIATPAPGASSGIEVEGDA